MRPPPGSTGSHSPPGGGCRAASWRRPDPRRSARPTPFSLAAIAALVLPPVLAELTAARADGIDARAVISSPRPRRPAPPPAGHPRRPRCRVPQPGLPRTPELGRLGWSRGEDGAESGRGKAKLNRHTQLSQQTWSPSNGGEPPIAAEEQGRPPVHKPGAAALPYVVKPSPLGLFWDFRPHQAARP